MYRNMWNAASYKNPLSTIRYIPRLILKIEEKNNSSLTIDRNQEKHKGDDIQFCDK